MKKETKIFIVSSHVNTAPWLEAIMVITYIYFRCILQHQYVSFFA
jgi:hypothetical protein